MQNFTDSQGRFVFPEQLFPEVSGPRAVPPSVGARRATILRGTAAAHAFAAGKASPDATAGSAALAARTGLGTGTGGESESAAALALEWSRSVLDFHGIWSPLPAEMIHQAVEILQILAGRGDGSAAYALGATSITTSAGTTPLVAPNERRSLLRQALKADVNRAWYRVGVNSDSRGDAESALSRFKRGADRGDSACLYTLGLAYIQGQFGLQVDFERGINLLELAIEGADADFPRAPYFLGKIMLSESAALGVPGLEHYVTADRARGLDLIERSAVLGFAPALLRMAEANLGPERGFDCASALRYLSLAACQEIYRRFNQRAPVLEGAPEAQIVKWLLCGYENVVAKNEEWAFKFAEISATDENASALFALAYFYEVGIATKPDMDRARALYNMSSARGFAAASARLEQLDTGKPQLRRSLTRQDHDAKMRKHYAALMRGDAGAPSAAMTDESTLEDASEVPGGGATSGGAPSKNSLPESVDGPKATLTAPHGSSSTPYGSNGTPQGLNGESLGAGVPYPVSPVASPGSGHMGSQSASGVVQNAPSVEDKSTSLPYPVSPKRVAVLPYPADSTPASPWTSEPSSPRSFSSLPYPSSPPKASIRRSPEHSPRTSMSASYRHISASQSSDSIQSIARKPVGSNYAPGSAPTSAPTSALTSAPTSVASSEPDSGPNSGPASSAATSNLTNLSTTKPPSAAARLGPTLKPVPTDLMQNAPFLKPHASSDSFKTVAEQPVDSQIERYSEAAPSSGPTVPPLAPPPAPGSAGSSASNSAPSSAGTSPTAYSAPQFVRLDRPENSRRFTDLSNSSGESPPGSSAVSVAPSATSAAGSRSTSPRRRPLSAQWVRQSFNGANRFFSTTSLTNTRQVSPSPSGASSQTSLASGPDEDLRRRSQSPLRKILGASAEQRAAAARRDRRSFTEAALAELANAPKVPVQPIKKERVPGVAYTFEEMGVESVTNDKNDRCVIQ